MSKETPDPAPCGFGRATEAIFDSCEHQTMWKQYALGLYCLLMVTGGCMNQAKPGSSLQPRPTELPNPALRVRGVRYQVKDVDRAVAFYRRLGFKLDNQAGSAFAEVSLDDLAVLLSGPGSSGSRPLPDGRRQEPGGWNRLVLRVNDLPARIAEMKATGFHFRNEMETGPGGRQIQLEDPDGNPIELFEPASKQIPSGSS